MIRISFFAAIALMAVPALAQQFPQTSAAGSFSSKRETLGYEIAKITNSEALTRVQLQKMLSDTLPKQFAANADFVELESAFPGLTNKFVSAMAPVILKNTLTRLPILWQRLGAVYAEALTEAELEKAFAFYRSPVGIKVIDVMGRRSDFTRVMQESLKDPEGKLTADALRSGQQIGIRAIGSELSHEELAEIERFEKSPVGPKLGAIAPRFAQISADWGNEPDPELDAELERVVQSVLQPYLAEKAKP